MLNQNDLDPTWPRMIMTITMIILGMMLMIMMVMLRNRRYNSAMMCAHKNM